MNLYLLRHSNATESPPVGGSDIDRPLTNEGRAKCRAIGDAMQRLGLKFDRIVSSPAARARETAELVRARLRPVPPLEIFDALWIGGSRATLLRRLKRLSAPRRELLLVGHQPDLGALLAHLTSGGLEMRMTFKKGGLAKLAITTLRDGRCAMLEWLLTPRQLRLIAEG
jgi:phosphohistidine phosphatase